MIRRFPSGSIRTWVALAFASVTVLAVAVVVALALGIGLMSLVFISNRRGYDEAVKRDH
jgi:hypothetical protein